MSDITFTVYKIEKGDSFGAVAEFMGQYHPIGEASENLKGTFLGVPIIAETFMGLAAKMAAYYREVKEEGQKTRFSVGTIGSKIIMVSDPESPSAYGLGPVKTDDLWTLVQQITNKTAPIRV